MNFRREKNALIRFVGGLQTVKSSMISYISCFSLLLNVFLLSLFEKCDQLLHTKQYNSSKRLTKRNENIIKAFFWAACVYFTESVPAIEPFAVHANALFGVPWSARLLLRPATFNKISFCQTIWTKKNWLRTKKAATIWMCICRCSAARSVAITSKWQWLAWSREETQS